MNKTSVALLAACALSSASFAYAQDHAVPADAATPADNTAVNKRDQDHDTTTPMDQPNNKADIDVAASVRSAIVDDKSLSMKAHNVKLVASSGVVVLRGPVASADEKERVAKIARAVAGVNRVDNQLDIAQ
jgi:osmotically-inducible protein OsmY